MAYKAKVGYADVEYTERGVEYTTSSRIEKNGNEIPVKIRVIVKRKGGYMVNIMYKENHYDISYKGRSFASFQKATYDSTLPESIVTTLMITVANTFINPIFSKSLYNTGQHLYSLN